MKQYKLNVWDSWYYHMESHVFKIKSEAIAFAKEQKAKDRYCHCELYHGGEEPYHRWKSLGFVG